MVSLVTLLLLNKHLTHRRNELLPDADPFPFPRIDPFHFLPPQFSCNINCLREGARACSESIPNPRISDFNSFLSIKLLADHKSKRPFSRIPLTGSQKQIAWIFQSAESILPDSLTLSSLPLIGGRTTASSC